MKLKILSSSSPKKRVNWKKELRLERERVLNEVRRSLIDKKRSIPKEWERGFMSAVSVVEMMK